MEPYEISSDPARLDIDVIHQFLTSSYWALGIPRDIVERSIRNSLCFGAYARGNQIGFARVITDRATFTYLADVFVLPEHRGRGVAQSLIRNVLAHPDLQNLRRFLLGTQDAHSLYTRFGFAPLSAPDMFLTIHDPDVYTRSGSTVTKS
jgi:GNAT superfamily N-acetyltransferase